MDRVRGPSDEIAVLHVDDDATVAEVTAEHLERQGDRLEVATVDAPEAALAHLDEHAVDCVVSDYDMPETDGMELLQLVREKHGDLPFVLYTGKGSEEVASEAIAAGVTDYLQKTTGEENYQLLANRIIDAVERRRAETSYREIFEGVPAGIVIHDAETGEFVDMNERYAEMYGYESQEEFLEAGFGVIHPDDHPEFSRERGQERVEAAREEGPQSFEWLGETKDGDVFWHQVHLAEMTIHGKDRIVAVVRRKQEEKKREQELRDTKETLEAVIAASPDAIMAIDVDGHVTLWNPAAEAIFGWSQEEVLGEPHPIIPEVREEEFAEHKERAFAGEGISGKETVRKTKDGDLIDVNISTAPVRDAEGEIVGGMAIIEDISERKEHERQVERYERIVENLPVAVYRTDDAGTILDLNPAAADMAGVTDPDDLRGDSVLEFYPESGDRDTLVRRLREEGEVDGLEIRAETAEGEEIWVEVTATRVDEDGEVYYDGIVRDVTDRRERQRELERHERLVTNLPVGVYRTDAYGNVLDANEAALDVIDADSLEEAQQHSVVEMYATDEAREAVTERLLDDGVVEAAEVPMESLAGERKWVEVSSREAEEGGESYYDGIVRDITERKEREREITRTRKLLSQAQEVAEVGGWTFDLRGDPPYEPDWTDKMYDIVGMPRDEEPPALDVMLDRYHDEDRDYRDRVVEAALERGEGWDVEARFETFDGETKWVRSIAEPTYDDGDLVRVRGSFQDVTERKERERRIERQNERLEAFAEVVSHDLRNPLNVAQARLEMAREDDGDEDLAAVADAHDRIETLIEDMLALAREGDGEIDETAIDLATVAEDAWESVPTGDATLAVEVSSTIRGDAEQIRRVLENLFRNAVAHGGEDVAVTVRDVDGGFSVEDDGPGFPEDAGDSLLEPGHTTHSEGTGFGLAIVDRIAERHGWDVALGASDAGGARVTFTGVERA